MVLTGKLTEQEVNDAGSLVRSKWYWPQVLLKNALGVFFVGAAVWATIASWMSGDHGHFRAELVVWIIVALIIWRAVAKVRRSRQEDLVRLNAGLPDSIELDASGLQMKYANGAATARSWSAVQGWRWAGSVALLQVPEVQGIVILPMTQLPPEQREVLLGVLTNQLGPEQRL
jgi:hypothetical protein